MEKKHEEKQIKEHRKKLSFTSCWIIINTQQQYVCGLRTQYAAADLLIRECVSRASRIYNRSRRRQYMCVCLYV